MSTRQHDCQWKRRRILSPHDLRCPQLSPHLGDDVEKGEDQAKEHRKGRWRGKRDQRGTANAPLVCIFYLYHHIYLCICLMIMSIVKAYQDHAVVLTYCMLCIFPKKGIIYLFASMNTLNTTWRVYLMRTISICKRSKAHKLDHWRQCNGSIGACLFRFLSLHSTYRTFQSNMYLSHCWKTHLGYLGTPRNMAS